jgi:hypothetical protein
VELTNVTEIRCVFQFTNVLAVKPVPFIVTSIPPDVAGVDDGVKAVTVSGVATVLKSASGTN